MHILIYEKMYIVIYRLHKAFVAATFIDIWKTKPTEFSWSGVLKWEHEKYDRNQDKGTISLFILPLATRILGLN